MFGRPKYQPLNRIEVSVERLRNNYNYLQGINKSLAVTPVLKSNAYGHGLVLVAKVVDGFGVPFVCVDSLYEAYELSKLGFKTPILIMGHIHPGSLETKRLPFSFAASSFDQLEAVRKYQPQAGVHLFVDTGMHREGFVMNELPELLEYLRLNKEIKVEGLMSHLGRVDRNQMSKFREVQQVVRSAGFLPKWVHILNSSGLLNSHVLDKDLGNVARCGIALYGIDPDGKDRQLQQVLKLKSRVGQLKQLQQGDKVGYDFTFTARRIMEVAVLPIGYNDGLDRRLSGKGVVAIEGKNCPIVGRISMNITVVDVTDVVGIKVGDEVEVYGDLAKAAKICGTIPYELLVHLVGSTKRVLA